MLFSARLFVCKRAFIAGLIAAAAAILLTACGASSPQSASTLLKQTFSGAHKVNSGRLSFSISLDPHGSSTLTQPIVLAFGGPFQSRGTGKLPESDFTVQVSSQGQSGSLSVISTGSQGFVSLAGTGYQLPQANFEKLESSFAKVASSGGGGKSQGILGKLGIDPLSWLTHPAVVGSASVGGTPTTHVRAQIDVPVLLRDVNAFLEQAGSLGVSGASKLSGGISAATQSAIAGDVQHPTIDVWTGNSDKTIRRLTIALTFPVTGQLSSLLGGMTSAAIALTLQYTDLNQPQTITAPTHLQPYSVFSSKLAGLIRDVEGSLEGAATGTGTGTSSASTGSATTTGSAGSTSGGTATSPSVVEGATGAYSKCITAAGQDVAKMQQCASLLNGN